MTTRITNQTEMNRAAHDSYRYGTKDIELAADGPLYVSEYSGSFNIVGGSGELILHSGCSAILDAADVTVKLYETTSADVKSGTVLAFENTSVAASGSAKVTAGPGVTVTVWEETDGSKPEVTGGVQTVKVRKPVIRRNRNGMPALEWAELYGVQTEEHDGRPHLVLFKGVYGNELESGHGLRYPIGQTVAAADWNPNYIDCGYGLHFSPTAVHTRHYVHHDDSRVRFLKVLVDPAETIALGNKVKARSCFVVGEVDIHGRPIETAAPADSVPASE